MKVSVRAYGNLRRFLKATDGRASLDFEGPATVRDALARLGIPAWETSKISINGDLASEDQPLSDGDALSLFAPMHGGESCGQA